MPLPVANLAAGGQLYSGACLFRGFSLLNENGAAQTFQILDGADSTGIQLSALRYGTLAGSTAWLGDQGVLATIGIWVVIPAGPLVGAIYVTPLDDHEWDQCMPIAREHAASGTYGQRSS